MKQIIKKIINRIIEKSSMFGILLFVFSWVAWYNNETHQIIIRVTNIFIDSLATIFHNLSNDKNFITQLGGGIISLISGYFIGKRFKKDDDGK